MGIFKDIFDTASRHNSRKNQGTALFVCPKCGEKIRVEDYKWKADCEPKLLAKETKCPNCGTQMKRKTIFGLED